MSELNKTLSCGLLGLGVVSPYGDSLEKLYSAVKNKQKPKALESNYPYFKETYQTYNYKVPQFELLKKVPPAVERRLGPLPRFCYQALTKAINSANFQIDDSKKMGIIVGTAHGITSLVERFSHRIIKEGGLGASPLLFSNSVHNNIASFCSMSLNVYGPATTLTNLNLTLASCLERAAAWISEGRVDYVLLAVGDEFNVRQQDYYHNKNRLSLSGIYDPLKMDEIVISEGAIGLLLSSASHPKANQNIIAEVYSSIHSLELPKNPIVDVLPDQDSLLWLQNQNKDFYNYTSQYGHFTTASVLDFALASYALSKNEILASTIEDNEFSVINETNTKAESVDLIQLATGLSAGHIHIENKK